MDSNSSSDSDNESIPGSTDTEDSSEEDSIVDNISSFISAEQLEKIAASDIEETTSNEECSSFKIKAEQLEKIIPVQDRKILNFLNRIDYVLFRHQILRASFQDVTPSFADEVPFLVDGDSLMITIMMDKNWSCQLGGSSLHLVYLFERYLNIFVKRGGTFHLVFFQNWRNIWHTNWNILLHRSVLNNHFSRNAEKYPVHFFDHCFDENFKSLVSAIRPGFILTNMDAYDNSSDIFNIKGYLLKHIMNINLLSWLKMDLPCINTNYIDVDVSMIKGYYLDCNDGVRSIVDGHLNKFVDFITDLPKIEEYMELPDCINIPDERDIRNATFLIAAYFFYKRNKDENMIKVFFLTATMMEFLELKNRCCPKFSASLVELDVILKEWHECMFSALSTLENENYNYSAVSDMWHGILFGHVCRFVSLSIIDCSEKLGSEVGFIYEKMVQDFNNFGFSINAYPIAVSNLNIKFKTIDSSNLCQIDTKPLVLIQNPLVLKFCNSILHDIKWRDPPKNLTKKAYSEEHHYHSMKVIHDEHEYIPSSVVQPLDKWQQRRYLKQRNLHSKYMTLYGSSIEGRPLETSGVARSIKNPNNCKEKKSKIKKKTQDNSSNVEEEKLENENKDELKNRTSKSEKQKVKKKADIIREANNKTKFDKQEKKDREQFEELKAQSKKCGVNLTALLQQINLMLMKKTCCESSYKLETMFLKLKIMSQLLKSNIRDKDTETEKSIFLTVRQILHSGCDLTLKQKELLSKYLCNINCTEIAKRNSLPVEKEKKVSPDDAWIRFQLEELGPDLIREIGGEPDSRAKGFIPDPWQKKLFDIVDNRQSALIVAPTSSGKTYASYYCMESILREGTEGVVVYVAPTKALVNQVAATVYARFKDTDMPEGKSVYGIFTRDYKMYALNSQILVTVPQCLEVLLLSPRRQLWVKQLKYVIFDEIHCIQGELGGASFERCLLLIRCPFLALSATIRNPEGLHEWLQRAEEYKHCRDTEARCLREEKSYKVHLVEHSERHSDLTKFTYGNKQFHHLHPYAELEKNILYYHQGIPSHMTLSPAETMQLYDAMCKINPDNLTQLTPVVFFSSLPKDGFISRNLVRKYASDLSAVLVDWYENHTQYFEDTIRALRPKEIDQIYGTGKEYILQNIVNFVLNLKEQNMLPALIFAYDRILIKCMMEELTDYLEKHMKNSSKPIRNSTQKEKKSVLDHLETKYKTKGLNSYSGNAENALGEISSKMNYIDKRNLSGRYAMYDKPLNLISDNAEQTLQGIGVMTSDDMAYIEQRLRRANITSKNIIARAMRQGVCMHHGGLNNLIRSSVEMLFRKKLLNVVFATGTLALGIHMPCKTAVIAGNSPYLNSLEYHQMSGRAGRRGYDTAGNVIFLGLNPRKQHSLLTAKLPYLKGNFPITVTLILRTLLLVSDVTEKGKKTEEATNMSISRVMAMFENSLCFMENPDLKINIKHFFSFTLQLLKIQDFINDHGEPLKWCGIVTHLHYHEPGNLAFVYLLRTGVIRKICTEIENVHDVQYTLLGILSNLFTKVPLDAASKRKFKNSKVVLDPLPEIVHKALEQYNKEVLFVFDQYFANVANHFNASDDTLPLSLVRIVSKYSTGTGNNAQENIQNKFLSMCVPKLVCSSFAALSGNADDNAYSEETLISNIKQKMATDVKVIPLINLKNKLNGYAVDFYRHGIVKSIREDNGVKGGAEFTLLLDFLLVIKTICVSLEEMKLKNENDIVYTNFKLLEKKYGERIEKAFSRAHF